MVESKRKCSRCQEDKSESKFNKKGRGLMSWCRECQSEYYRSNKNKKLRRSISLCYGCDTARSRYGGKCYACWAKEGLKPCPQCKTAKPLEDFNTKKTGRAARACRACQRKKKGKLDGGAFSRNPSEVQRYTSLSPKRRSRDRYLRATYGITIEDQDRMERDQGRRCAICRLEKRLVVDHDHETGTVRGLLCNPCNKAMGLLGDNAETLDKAANYLRQRAASAAPGAPSRAASPGVG